ncbi:MAG: Rieske 2Fe-2S domain-containing protein, partial [Candidatus Methylomirabilales bacterium]
YGEAVIGNLGSARQGRLTAIGDTVNVASRIEVANKEAGTRLLISEELYEQVKDDVTMDDFVRVKLRGTAERKTLYEISGVDSSALPAQHDLDTRTDEVRQHLAGLEWTRVLSEGDLPVGGHRVVERQEFDLLLIRTKKNVYACNNACPHLHLPLKESKVVDEAIVCRWHESRFDLATGEIKHWCAALEPDGTSKEMEYLGNISKNRHPLNVFPVRVAEGHIWVALGTES